MTHIFLVCIQLSFSFFISLLGFHHFPLHNLLPRQRIHLPSTLSLFCSPKTTYLKVLFLSPFPVPPQCHPSLVPFLHFFFPHIHLFTITSFYISVSLQNYLSTFQSLHECNFLHSFFPNSPSHDFFFHSCIIPTIFFTPPNHYSLHISLYPLSVTLPDICSFKTSVIPFSFSKHSDFYTPLQTFTFL